MDKATQVATLRAKGWKQSQIGEKLGMSVALVGYYSRKAGVVAKKVTRTRRVQGGTLFQKSAAALREKAAELTRLAEAIAGV